jgi:pilus assembly protein CpaD
MHNIRTMIPRRFAGAGILLRAAMIVGCAALACGCNTDQQMITGVPTVPTDYRLRHPITLTEMPHTLRVFIGANRASLTPMQRAQVLAFAQNWTNEATGGVVISVPVGAANQRSAAAAAREIGSILAATGVPRRSVAVRSYRVTPRTFAPVRIAYPRVAAQAGPCGLWPQNIGPGFDRSYFENEQPWNFGCDSQRNLAAMVDNPADLVQPRAETPIYEPRRTAVINKYTQGQSTGTAYVDTNSGKISNVGQ